MREFFGIGGYQRPADGFMSWQHILFVSCFMAVMIFLGIFLGLRYKHRSEKEKNKVLIITAILMDSIELFKIIFICFRNHDPMAWKLMLPLFFCSIPLIALPLGAFSKGRVKEAAIDFVFIFGLLIAFMGTYGAGNNFGTYPVLCFDNFVSCLTHSIAGFAALYLIISGMVTMKKQNIGISFAILGVYCVAAYIADIIIPYNYMFLMRGDGTPYDIFYNLVNGNKVLYPLIVVALFMLYIVIFYAVFYLIKKARAKK